MEEQNARYGTDSPVNIPIQMCATFDTTGNIHPGCFRLETPEHTIETVRVCKTVSRDEINYLGIREKRFICTSVIGELEKIIEIRYNVGTQKWRIFQFLS